MGLEELRRIRAERDLPKPKKQYRIPKKSAKKLRQEKEEKELMKQAREMGKPLDGDLDQWFEDRMRESLPVCAECGFRADWVLNPGYEKIWKASQAHILPKKKGAFPSVATHPLNHLVLFPSWGGHLCGDHGVYDSSWYSASGMKVWETVKERFIKHLYPLLTQQERSRLPEILQKLIDDQ